MDVHQLRWLHRLVREVVFTKKLLVILKQESDTVRRQQANQPQERIKQRRIV